jgi:hypothetical protein
MPLRVDPKTARRLGVPAAALPASEIKLPTLPGVAGQDLRTEHDFQSDAVRHYRRALGPTGDMIAVPLQRHLGHLSDAHRKSVIRNLSEEGTRTGILDTLAEWDTRLGGPGNLGHCWIEFKRAARPEPVKVRQVEFMFWRRAQGKVAGWAQAIEHCEALLDEAGAPRLFRPALRENVPPWWYALKEEPPLWCDPPWIIGSVRLADGNMLRLGRPT